VRHPEWPGRRTHAAGASVGGRHDLSPWHDEPILDSEFIDAARAPTRDLAASS
jgi:hypothetical protein